MKVFVLLLLFLCTGWCFSQQSYILRGEVSTIDQKLLAGYNINVSPVSGKISEPEEKIRFTKSDFSLEVDFMPILLQVSADGYRDTIFVVDYPNQKIDIVLTRSQINLSEIVVKHIIPSFSNEKDRMEIQISNTALSEAGSAMDLLQKAPKVKVDENYGIYVGIEEASIYLNGREIPDLKILAMLSSKDIEKIDVITNPSVKYDSNAKIIIDIITRTRTAEGWNAELTGRMTKGEFWREHLQVDIRGGTSKYSVFGSYTFAPQKVLYKESYGTGGIVVNLIPGEQYVLTDIDTEYKTIRSNNVRLGGEYYLTNEHTLGVETGLQSQRGEKNSDVVSHIYLGSDLSNPSLDILSSSTSGYDRKNLLGMIYHTYKNKSGYIQKTIVDLSHYKNDDSATNDDTNNPEVSILYQNKTVNNHYSVRTDINIRPNDFLKLDVGAKYQYRRNKNDNMIFEETVPTYTNPYRYDDRMVAGYAFLSYTYSDLVVRGGSRLEYVKNKTNTNLFSQDTVRWNLFPNIMIDYRINDNMILNAAYIQNVHRPSFAELNPATAYIAPNFYNRGNPALKDEKRHNFQVKLNYKKMSFGVSYTKRSDAVVWVMETDDNDPSITWSTHRNVSSAGLYSLDAIIPLEYELFNIFLSTGLIHADAEDKATDLSLKQTLWYGTLNMDFNLPFDIKLNSNHRYFTKGLMNVFYFKPTYRTDLSLKKTFLNKNLTAVFMWNDIFKTDKMRTYTTMSGNDVSYNYTYDQSMVSLSLSYKFKLQK